MKNYYVFLGPEEKDASDRIDELYKNASKASSIEKKHLFGFDSEDLETAISDILSPSLFGTDYFIIFDNAEEIGDKDAERLSSAISSCQSDSYLVMRSKENKISLKLEKLCRAENKKTFYLMQAKGKKDFVHSIFAESGFVLTDGAADAFISLVDEDKLSFIKARDKLISFIPTYKKDNQVLEEDVYNCLEKDKEEDGYTVFYHIANRNTNALMASVENILNTSPRGLGVIIPSLIICLRRALAYIENTSPEPWVLECMSSGKVVVRNPSEKANITLFSKNYSKKSAKALLNFMLDADINVRKIQPAEFQKIYFQTKLARLVGR